MNRCRVLGHRFRFSADGATLRWRCERACGAAGEKRYADADAAARYARAFDRQDARDLGRRPTLSVLPLWMVRKARARSRSR
jgi:hypothetical protein